MAKTTIEWADYTFNPWIGCTKISEGCRHCYAESLNKRYGWVDSWGPQGTRKRTSEQNWKQVKAWNKFDLGMKVFCASLADVFEDRPELMPWRRDLFELIEQTRDLIWMLLTKRPENIRNMISQGTGRRAEAWLSDCNHVWLGTTVEDQKVANKRIPYLLQNPAAVRFISCEPLLGPIDLGIFLCETWTRGGLTMGKYLDWVIVGGESGPGARPMDPDWARSIREQCKVAGVPYFCKQMGGHPKRHLLEDMPADLRIREFPEGRDAG